MSSPPQPSTLNLRVQPDTLAVLSGEDRTETLLHELPSMFSATQLLKARSRA